MYSACSLKGLRLTAVLSKPLPANNLVQNRMVRSGCCPSSCSRDMMGYPLTGSTSLL